MKASEIVRALELATAPGPDQVKTPGELVSFLVGWFAVGPHEPMRQRALDALNVVAKGARP